MTSKIIFGFNTQIIPLLTWTELQLRAFLDKCFALEIPQSACSFLETSAGQMFLEKSGTITIAQYVCNCDIQTKARARFFNTSYFNVFSFQGFLHLQTGCSWHDALKVHIMEMKIDVETLGRTHIMKEKKKRILKINCLLLFWVFPEKISKYQRLVKNQNVSMNEALFSYSTVQLLKGTKVLHNKRETKES